MRYQVVVPMSVVNAPSGAAIHVYTAGTTTHTPMTLYADGSSANTLANPYTHPGGKVVFYLPATAQVQVGVQPTGAPAPVVTAVTTPATKAYTYSVRLAGGRPVDWNVY